LGAYLNLIQFYGSKFAVVEFYLLDNVSLLQAENCCTAFQLIRDEPALTLNSLNSCWRRCD